ncbi:MAG: hypothetical protein LBV42_02165 [Methanobrevibacter sp.]|jgi:predicted aldo/keto reductase-like oxidoreductase|nr:hypothetical protein [Methanobrevibacter sp.]
MYDENHQVGKKGLNYATSKGLTIMIMETLRGGMLINKLSKESKKLINNFQIKRSPAEWALRGLYNDDKIDVVISGMIHIEEVKENIAIASDAKLNSLTGNELDFIDKLKADFRDKVVVDCTACGYYLPCPYGVDILIAFSFYNDKKIQWFYSTYFLFNENNRE